MKAAVLILGAAATLAVAGCGSTSTTPGASASAGGASAGGAGRRGAAGELAQINGTTLILNSQSGDITVATTASTTVQRTSTGTVADIVTGSCIAATGTKDATGAVTAQAVRVTAKRNGTCASGRPGGGNRPPGRSPNGSGNPAPPANLAFVAGEVTIVDGTSVTVQPATGAAQTITVPTTVRVSRSMPAAFSDLAVGNCVQANGTRDSSGTVTATNLNVVPMGPSGCFTGGGFGGFGGSRGGPGGGGAQLG